MLLHLLAPVWLHWPLAALKSSHNIGAVAWRQRCGSALAHPSRSCLELCPSPQMGHYTYECKNERVYLARPSRTQQLLNPKVSSAQQ